MFIQKEIKMSRDYYNTDKIYGVPIEEIGCPGCGRKYGHHKTKVDLNSQECCSCSKDYTDVELVDAKYYIETILGYKPLNQIPWK